MRMGAALGNIQTALLTSGANAGLQLLSQGLQGFSLLMSKGHSEAFFREKAKKQAMGLGLLLHYLRKLKKKFR